ncbi:MAG: alpha/beta hydrolase [Cyanobacteria bacterium CRU_2_1]|nr:alpha/beta hydrolase [Cyanobacteria bacterium CRU_2_1]
MVDWWQTNFPKGRQTLTIADARGREVAIAYGEAGMGQPLFLLHGIGSWSYNWRYNIQALSQHVRVICVDAKGYGFSEASEPPEVPGHQVIELARIIQALCDRPVMVAAESLGALTALALAQAEPTLIDRLILINVPVFPQRLPSWRMQLLAHLPLSWVQFIDQRQLLRPFAPFVRQVTHWLRREVVADPSLITSEEIYWLTYPYLHRPGTLAQFAADLRLAAQEIDRFHCNQPSLIRSIQSALPDVTCPTLILWADHDQWFPLENGQALHDRLPNSQLQIIPNCGHVASSGNAGFVNQAIREFILEAASPH